MPRRKITSAQRHIVESTLLSPRHDRPADALGDMGGSLHQLPQPTGIWDREVDNWTTLKLIELREKKK